MSSTPKSTCVFSMRSSGACCRRPERTWGRAAQAPKCLKAFYTSWRRFAPWTRGGAIPGACETTILRIYLLPARRYYHGLGDRQHCGSSFEVTCPTLHCLCKPASLRSWTLSPSATSHGSSFTGEGGLEDDSSSRSGVLTSGNNSSSRKSTGQGDFFLKKLQLPLTVLARFAREGKNGATANGRFHSRIFCYVGVLAEI